MCLDKVGANLTPTLPLPLPLPLPLTLTLTLTLDKVGANAYAPVSRGVLPGVLAGAGGGAAGGGGGLEAAMLDEETQLQMALAASMAAP